MSHFLEPNANAAHAIDPTTKAFPEALPQVHPNKLADNLPETLRIQAQLDELARRLAMKEGIELLSSDAEPSQAKNSAVETTARENENGNKNENEEPQASDALPNTPPTFKDTLEAFVNEQAADAEFDVEALKAKIDELAHEIAAHQNNVLETSHFETFAQYPVADKTLGDLRPEEIEAMINQYKADGHFEAADILADQYQQFVRVLNQKAIEGHLFQQKTAAYNDLSEQLEWKEVEQAYISRFPELKPYEKEVTRYIETQLSSNPLLPFTNKFVAVRDAINALGLGSKVQQNNVSGTQALPPDATLTPKKVNGSNLDSKKNYRLQDLQKMDYRKMSPELLADLQQAMFEGRIEAE